MSDWSQRRGEIFRPLADNWNGLERVNALERSSRLVLSGQRNKLH